MKLLRTTDCLKGLSGKLEFECTARVKQAYKNAVIDTLRLCDDKIDDTTFQNIVFTLLPEFEKCGMKTIRWMAEKNPEANYLSKRLCDIEDKINRREP